MGMVILLSGAIISVVSAPGGPVAASPSAMPEPIHTRQTLFAIPFRMDASARSARDPIQVLLYVSTNRGATWELTSQAEPEKGHFLFRAGSEGEFWFIIRTAVRGAQMQAPANEKPGLRVLVDTTPPKLELVAQRGTSGQFIVRWRITEASLKPESLTIQYRVEPEKPWQSVAIDRPPDAGAGPEYVGEATWWQPGEIERVEIRGEVADLAGNTAVSHAQVGASLGTIPRPAPDSPPGSNPSGPSREAGLPQLNPPEGSLKGRLPSSAWRPVRSAQGPAATLIRSPPAALVASPRAVTHSAPSEAGDAPRFRLVNALTFGLEYDLGAIPPTSDEQVEFWGTRDGGRTWLNYGTDPDRRSPMVVAVSEEGVYGFRISIRRGGDGASAAPPSGAAPDLWIVVRGSLPVAVSDPVHPGRIVDAHAVAPARPGQPSGL